jgi:S1-C subfamily serine protease
MVAGVILLGVGVIYGGVWLIGKFEEKAATVSQFDLPPEVKARDAARAAQLQKEKAEQEAEEAKGRAETLDFLTQYVSNNDTKVAAELMKEMDAISVELQAIRADADASNDPKDLHVFWTRSLEEHAAKNNVLHHWLGGRPASIIATALWGDATSPKPRGQVADFLMGGNYASTGTGFFISSDGWLLTNQHVVGDATEVDIRGEDGVIRKAKVLKADAEADVALLKAESAPAHWLHFTAEEVQMGADVCTVGFPNADIQGVEPKYTAGTVSSLSGIRDDHDNYQTTVPVQPGNSGGPLVEMKSGNVVGIVASILRHEAGAENVSYAIKGGVVQRVLSAVPEAAGAMSGPASSPRGADTVALAANVRASIVLVLVK